MNAVFATIAAAAFLEAGAAALVHWLRGDCQWLITPRDLTPKIDTDGLKRFLDHGWDPELGWTRKPDTTHDEIDKHGNTCRYHIDATGARRNPGFEDRRPAILVYGDSYAFARQVNDHETWAHCLSKLLDVNVANKGVGNYGLDQALLRLEREFDDQPAPVVLMAVVPETICRVLGTWRHFSEYGNTFAFKPRFVLNDGELSLVPNPMETPGRFFRIPELLDELKVSDEFYRRKFAPDMLRFPYLWHLWRSRRRNLPLMAAALADRVLGDNRRTFCRILERNIDLAAAIYREQAPVALMAAIVKRFTAFVRSRGAQPVFVMLPQLFDLRHLRVGDHYYAPFLERIAGMLTIIDLGPFLATEDDDGTHYIDDRFGGHLSVEGNRLAAEHIAEIVAALVKNARPAGRLSRKARS